MRIIDAKWTPHMNYLWVECQCGLRIVHRADRWQVRCPAGHRENLGVIRERYVAEQQEVEYRLPKITASWTVKVNSQVISEQSQLDYKDLPRNIMDEVEALVGNGLARVAISTDMGIMDYGTGAKGMATVSLTCNQDVKTIEKAADLAGQMARGFAQENRQRAENELQQVIQQRAGVTQQGPRY